MLPVLLAGGAALAAFLLTGCSPQKKELLKTIPPRQDPLEPDYPEDFDVHTETYRLYQEAKALGVTDRQLDGGCPTILYFKEGKSELYSPGNQDNNIQECEVREHILNQWDQESYAPMVEAMAGKPIPWSLDDLDASTSTDQEIRERATAAIARLDQELEEQGLKPDSPQYHPRRILGLFYWVAFPRPEYLRELNQRINELLEDTQPNILEERELTHLTLLKRSYDNLYERMEASELQDFQKYQREKGGFFLKDSADGKEFTALEALEKDAGSCTEFSKILYALFKMAGYQPHFLLVEPTKTQDAALRFLGLEDPLYWHVAVGLHHEGTDYVLDPTTGNPEADYEGASHPLSLRQYLALDYNNRGLDYFLKQDPPQFSPALEAFSKGMELDPQSLRIHLNLAILQVNAAQEKTDPGEKQLELEKSLELVNRALAIAPGDGPSYWVQAKILYVLDRPEEAFLAIQKAIQLDPFNWAHYHARAEILFARNDFQGAMKNLAVSLKLSPGKAGASVQQTLNNGYGAGIRRKYNSEERDLLERELLIAPHELMTQWDIATLHAKAGHVRLAKEEMEKIIANLEKAQTNLHEAGKSFASLTVDFLKPLLEQARNFPNPWQDLKDRIHGLGFGSSMK